VQVFSASGYPVYSRQHTGNNFTLDLSHLPSGVYLLRAGDVQTRLIIVK
ncbi:MAG: T9SS type A sorting domain-containing protein, partial [Chitinophagaceae bacterium]